MAGELAGTGGMGRNNGAGTTRRLVCLAEDEERELSSLGSVVEEFETKTAPKSSALNGLSSAGKRQTGCNKVTWTHQVDRS